MQDLLETWHRPTRKFTEIRHVTSVFLPPASFFARVHATDGKRVVST